MRKMSLWVRIAGAVACLAVLFAVSCEDGGGGGPSALSELATGAANAGPDQTVVYGATVTLDGSGSHGPGTTASPEGTTPTSYLWVQDPADTDQVTLDDDAIAGPTFSAPSVDATLNFELTVNGTYKDTVKITVKDLVVTLDKAPELWVGAYGVPATFAATVEPSATYGYRWSQSSGYPLPAEWKPSAVTDTLTLTTPLLTDLKVLPDDFGILSIGALSTARANSGSIGVKVTVTDQVPVERTVAGVAYDSGTDETVLTFSHVERTVSGQGVFGAGSTVITLAALQRTVVGQGVYTAAIDETVITFTAGGLTPNAHIGETCVFPASSSYPIVDNDATTITVAGDASGETADVTVDFDLVASAHVGEDCIFGASGTDYPITANTSTTITVTGDASGETADDVVNVAVALTADAHIGEHCIFDTAPGNSYDIVGNDAVSLTVDGDASDEAVDDGVDISSILATATVTVQIVGPTSGASVVPVGVPVFLNGGAGTTYAWAGTGTLTLPDGTSTDPTARVQMFVPADPGNYTFICTVDTTVKAVTVRAAEYVGVGSVANRTPDPDKGECAACHRGQYAYIGDQTTEWQASDHAKIFENMFARYGKDNYKDVSCFHCHTVGYNETDATSNGGFDDVAADAGIKFSALASYSDFTKQYPTVADKSAIQCEACHGPGSLHNGDTAGIGSVTLTGLCAQCHEGHGQEVTQWECSVHTQVVSSSHALTGDDCTQCHAGQGLPEYLREGKGPELLAGEAVSQNCGTCHDPHSLELRVEGRVTLPNGVSFDFGHSALCATCHTGRRDVRDIADLAPDAPHHGSQQAPMLAGTGAFEYTGYTYVNGPHTAGTVAKPTPARCNDCHMAPKKAFEELSHGAAADVAYDTVGGHTWKMTFGPDTPTILADDTGTYTTPVTLADTREFAVDEGTGASFVGLIEAGDVITWTGADASTDAVVAAVMSSYSLLVADPDPKNPTMFTGGAVTAWSITRTKLYNNGRASTGPDDPGEGCKSCHLVTDFAVQARADYDGDGTAENFDEEIGGLLAKLKLEIETQLLSNTGIDFAVDLVPDESDVMYIYTAGGDAGSKYDFPGYGKTNIDPDPQAWDATWEKLYKAAYNYIFVLEDKSGGVHNPGYAVGLLRSSLEDLGVAVGGTAYTAAP